MLHILNGDATLALLKQSSVKGTFLVWKDMLMEGPVTPAKGTGPGGLDWNARAAFMRDTYGIDPKKYLAGMKAFFTAYGKAAKGKEEVVFWFEEDFFCQIHLVYLLATLPEPLKRKGRAHIICPEKALGVRLPGAFPKLLAGKLPLEPTLLTLASKVWKAYALSSSKGWESLLKWAQSGKGFEPWPLLRSGLRSHLGRLPSANGKLNALDTALLHVLSPGTLPFQQFVRKVWSEPLVRPLGLGDLQVARYALDLARRPKPLLLIEGADRDPAKGKPIRSAEWKLHLTSEGRARLAETIGAQAVSPKAVSSKPAKPVKPSKSAVKPAGSVKSVKVAKVARGA
ncbi:MAG: DNA-directed polymerase subunit sigma [Fibrobacteres bacterium]|nr:DNA-directed polymerase subunit sigma [Fibrobacterota bacterium]